MLSDYFTNLDQVVIFALLAFILFFVFFVLISIHTFRMNDSEVEKMKRIPFDDNPENVKG